MPQQIVTQLRWPSWRSCVLDEEEKQELISKVLGPPDDCILGLCVRQPWASCFFLREGHKNVEWRKKPLGKTCFVAIHSGKALCSCFPGCFTVKSMKEALATGDEEKLEKTMCGQKWKKAHDVLERNRVHPGQGFPFSCIQGVVLFEGTTTKADLENTDWVVDNYGSYGWRVKKVLVFSTPINDVMGHAQTLSSLYKSWYIAHPTAENKLQAELWSRVLPYVI